MYRFLYFSSPIFLPHCSISRISRLALSTTSRDELPLLSAFCRFLAFGDRVFAVAEKTTATATLPSRSQRPADFREPATYPKTINGSVTKNWDKISVSKRLVFLLRYLIGLIHQCLGSDILHLKLFGTHLVVLNSEKTSNDLLNKRSSIYSDRYV